MAIFFIVLAFFSTLLGGYIGLRLKDRLHLTLGFSAGILLGVVAFELLPEISHLSEELKIDFDSPMIFLVGGFLLFHVVEKLFLIHHSHEESYSEHRHPKVGVLSSLIISTHSFVDGLSIGLAFQISTALGLTVALAVIAHAFSDGLNNVSLTLSHKNSENRAKHLLLVNAAAPILGGLLSTLITFPETTLLFYLAFFAGFLLYIGAADILPEAHSRHSSKKTIFATILGATLIYLISRFLGH